MKKPYTGVATRSRYLQKARAADAPPPEPTQRNLQVVATEMALGRAGACESLGLGYNTVRNHVLNVRHYYGVDDNVQLALRLGWLKIPEDLIGV